MNKEEWQILVKDHTKLKIEVLNQIQEEGEKYFDGIVDDYTSLTNKAYTTLSIFISLIGIFISILLSKSGNTSFANDKAALFSILILTGICSYCVYLLIKIIFPKYKQVKGNQPKPINFEALANISQGEQIRAFTLDSIEAIQGKIDYNEKILQIQLVRFENILKISSVTFIITIIIISISIILN